MVSYSLFLIGMMMLVGPKKVNSQGILPPRASLTREVLSLDGLWNFRTNNITVPPDNPDINVNMDLNIIPVPSSYNDMSTQKSLRNYAGVVTYNRTFFIPKSWQGKRVWLRFGSVCYSAVVTVNGNQVLAHEIGHLPFVTEIQDVLNYEAENNIRVAVSNILTGSTIPQGSLYTLTNGILARSYTFDFFDYSGIDRPVWLYTTSNAYVDDITITTALHGSSSGIVSYNISILGATHNTTFSVTILDKTGTEVASSSNQLAVHSITVNQANLWWPYLMDDNPGYLYTLRIDVIESDTLIDRYDQPFGIRELTWNNNTFKINGRRIYFRGFGRHEDSDFRGKGLDLPLIIRDHNLIRWIGANCYRTSHYPYAEEIMDLADQLGIMIVDEVPAVNTQDFGAELLTNHKQSITELYNRDKNRPSVVMWSCANEPKTQYNASGPFFQQIVAHTKALDSTRPVTAAIAQFYNVDNAGQYMDIISFNRYQAWYDNTAELEGITARIIEEAQNWRAKYNKPVLISEYGADTLEGLHFLPTYIWSEEFQTGMMSEHFKAFDTLREENEWFIGEFIWNFADFKTAETYTRVGGNKKGLFTRSRQPKSSAFLLRKRYWAIAHSLDQVALPSDLENYIAAGYEVHDEM